MEDIALRGFDAGPIWGQRAIVREQSPLVEIFDLSLLFILGCAQRCELRRFGKNSCSGRRLFIGRRSPEAPDNGRKSAHSLFTNQLPLSHYLMPQVTPADQDHSLATRARMITTKTADINWEKWDAAKIRRHYQAISHQVRACHPSELESAPLIIAPTIVGPI